MRTRNLRSLVIGAILVLIVSATFFVSMRVEVSREFVQAVMVLVGMLMTASLSAISRYVDGGQASPIIQIAFNESKTRAVLDEAITADCHEVITDRLSQSGSWELTPNEMLEQDPVLALAKLRIDIERELRRIAFDRGLNVHRVSIGYLVNILAQHEAIGPGIAAAIRDILPACNAAIHGGEVTEQVAREVLGVGCDLITILKAETTNLAS